MEFTLTPEQMVALANFNHIIHHDINTPPTLAIELLRKAT